MAHALVLPNTMIGKSNASPDVIPFHSSLVISFSHLSNKLLCLSRNAQFMWIQKALGLRRVRIQTFARIPKMDTEEEEHENMDAVGNDVEMVNPTE